jgi:hypothetical protein
VDAHAERLRDRIDRALDIVVRHAEVGGDA